MPPANAERMARRVGVHLMSLVSQETRSWLKQTCAQLDRLVVGPLKILDVKVQVDLLRWGSVGPLGRSVVRGELHADDPRAAFVQHAMEFLVVGDDVAVKHRGPERTFGGNISSIEDDDVADQFHARTVVDGSSV